jgi:hypothetical protein
MTTRPPYASAIALVLSFFLILPAFAQEQPSEEPIVAHSDANERSGEAEGEKDDPTARLQWQREAWGIVTPAFRATALAEGQKHSNKKNAAGPRWVSIGPAGADYEQNVSYTGFVRDSGRARTILPHPTDANIVYFLSSGGGLWRTNNWTAPNTTWTPLTDDLPTTGGGSVAFGKNPNTLYLGLGDFVDHILVGGSMVKSRNGGNSWEPMIELGNATSVRDVKVDTSTNRDIVLVATNFGLYRSADEGATYTAIPTFANLSVWNIVRTSAGWLASAQPCPAANNGLQCPSASTLYLSTDKGATWAPISNAGNVFSNNGRTTLAVGNAGDSVAYAYSATVGDTAMRDVYRSADGGQTWVANGVNSTKIPTNPVPGSTNMPNMNICRQQCWYNQMILVDPRDAARNTVWIGGDLAAAKTTNGGGTWSLATWWLYSQVPSLPYAHADFHTATFKSTGTPTIILGNDGGMNITTDDGATFSSDKNNGLVTHLYYSINGNPAFPNLVIGGLQDNGTRLRTDNSAIHNQIIGGDGLTAAYSIGNTNTVIGSVQGSGMRTNLSNQEPTVFQSFSTATAGLADVSFPFQTCVVAAPAGLDPTGRVFFHFTGARVWRSNNGGLSWNLIGSAVGVPSPGLPPARRFRSGVHNMGVSPQDLNRIAVGANGGFIDITTNGGATWTDIDLVAAAPGYQGFVANMTWQDNQNLWITSAAQAAGSARVIKATIASPAASWATATYQVKQNGLPDLPVTRVYFDPRDPSRNTIYAATHVGIYRTTDNGDNWAPYGTGLPTVRVNDIYMPPDGSLIRIGTYGRGVWELSQLELVSADLTDDVSTCDADGVVDNGETGTLTITLMNQGANNVNHVSVTLTSGNPNVSFPDGNVLSFPPVQKNNVSTGSIRVSVNGAAGIEAADFNMAIDAPELGLPTAFNVSKTHRVNYDEQLGVSATETAEAANGNWTASGDPTTVPNIDRWHRVALSPTRHVWFGPNNNGQTDGVKAGGPDEQSLVSPVLNVGSGPFSISFQHRFSFEAGQWDAGVIELSNNGGASWTDIAVPLYNGVTNPATSAPIGANRKAYVNRPANWPNFSPVTINLGTTYANQNVQIRFRIGADESTGAPGWDIDDITFSGITNTPFSALVPESGSCN